MITTCASLAVGVAGLLAGGAAPASAAIEIGQTGSDTFECDGPSTYFQEASVTAPTYTAPIGGVVTRWSTFGVSTGASVQFAILRPTTTASRFTTVAASDPATIAAGINSLPTRLGIQAGDTIGLLILSGEHNCALFGGGGAVGDVGQRDSAAVHGPGETFTYSNAQGSTRINVAAAIEADADGDGFGDETQDGCPSDATTQGACPDKLRPKTKIEKSPKNKSSKRRVSYRFSSSEPGSTFECKLDRKPFKPCSSPKRLKVKVGKHKFKVRAIDAAGNVDATPAKDRFRRTG